MGGPNSATKTKNSSRDRLIIARLSRRNRRHASRVAEAERAVGAGASVEAGSVGLEIFGRMKTFPLPLSRCNAWINQSIEEIREEVAHNHTRSEEDSRRLDHRVVIGHDRAKRNVGNTWDVKDVLD